MLALLVRSVFAWMVVVSMGLHGALVFVLAWLSLLGLEPPQVIPPQQGRYSVQVVGIQAPVVTADTHELIEKFELTEPTPLEMPSVFTTMPDRLLVPPLPKLPLPNFEMPKAPEPAKPAPEDPKAAVGPKPAPSSVGSEGVDADELPRHYSNPAPPYPADALAARSEGTVLLKVKIASSGYALSVALERSSGYPSLDQSAQSTVRRWVFIPAKRRGVAIDYEVLVPVRFELRSRQPR